MEILIREVQSGDIGALTRIWNDIIQTGAYSALDTPLTFDDESNYLAGLAPRGFCHVAEDSHSHQVVGFQNVETFATYTHAFDHVAVIGTCIDLSRRRSGIGSLLTQASVERAWGMRYEKLFTYVRADNKAALHFYRRLGFAEVGTARKHAKIRDTYIDSIYLEMFL